MKAIKKINNNVAICVDNDNNELIAFGKGIGFPKMPYEVDDLSKISLTFYQVNRHYYQLLRELPEDMLELSVEIVKFAQKNLKSYLNPNIVFTLADHISFAIQRLKTYKKSTLSYSFEIERLYRDEVELSKKILEMIRDKTSINLPKSEVTSIAMHLVNAQLETREVNPQIKSIDLIITRIIHYVEDEFEITVSIDSKDYHRLVMHITNYIDRKLSRDEYNDENTDLAESFRNKYPKIFKSAIEITDMIEKEFQLEKSDSEAVYMMIHIRRLLISLED